MTARCPDCKESVQVPDQPGLLCFSENYVPTTKTVSVPVTCPKCGKSFVVPVTVQR